MITIIFFLFSFLKFLYSSADPNFFSPKKEIKKMEVTVTWPYQCAYGCRQKWRAAWWRRRWRSCPRRAASTQTPQPSPSWIQSTRTRISSWTRSWIWSPLKKTREGRRQEEEEEEEEEEMKVQKTISFPFCFDFFTTFQPFRVLKERETKESI